MAGNAANNETEEELGTGLLGEDAIIKGRIGWRGYQKSDLRDSGPVVIGGINIKSRLYLDLSDIKHLSRKKYDESPDIQLKKGDVLLVQRGNGLGDTAYFDGSISEATINPTLIILSEFKGDPRFLFYYLSSPVGRESVLALASGSSIPALYQNHLKRLRYPKPPVAEQRAIAHILGTLDDKAELNRRMNETLEAMARALFKSWFVDFDPVRAKAEGRDPGLPKPLADLFPDSFEDSELGEIPRGWDAATLSDLATLNPESWSSESRPEMIDYVDLSNTKWGRIEAVTSYSKGDAPSRAQRVLRPRDTIVGTVRPGNGSYALISADGLTGSTGFAVLRPSKYHHSEFVYLAASAPENIDRLAHLADGAAYPAVRPEVVAATQVVKPDAEVMRSFSLVASSMLSKVAANEAETGTLAALRDALLPKLISGELRVHAMDRFDKGMQHGRN